MVMKLPRLCDSCAFYRGDDENTCKAFPVEIPLVGMDTHFEVLDGQEGETVYEYDPSREDELRQFRRLYPEAQMPDYLPKPGDLDVEPDVNEDEPY